MLRLFVIICLSMSLHAAELQIAAASDLTDVEAPLAAAFQKKSGNTIRWITGSSGVLSKQAENGAPYDVFLSASEAYVKELVAHDSAIADTVVIYAVGHLGLWSASGSVHELNDLLKPAVLHVAIANPAHAPYGVAAKESLESAGLWKRLEPKIVYGENVRQALQFAESGNADAVLTSWSLVRSKPAAVEVTAKHNPIRQAGVVLKSSHEMMAARDFLRFLIGPDARKILHDAGFGTAQ